jgi:hypothetical protein
MNTVEKLPQSIQNGCTSVLNTGIFERVRQLMHRRAAVFEDNIWASFVTVKTVVTSWHWNGIKILFPCKTTFIWEPRYRSRYSDWLRAVRRRGSRPGRVKNFLLSTSSRPNMGPTQLPVQWVPGIKRQWREAYHSAVTSAEVRKIWIYISAPPQFFMAQCLIR